ncbi:MAG: DUF4175 family protein, partial [Opitutales bacterium]
MKNSKGKGASSLPSSLKKQLDGLRTRLRLSEGSKALCTALGALIVSWFIVFGSDRLWDTPQPLLIFFSLTGWAAAIWVLALGYRLSIAQPSYDENLAKTAQSKFPALGDRLLGVIELCDPSKESSRHSAALREAAVAQVADEAASYDLGKAIDLSIIKRVMAGFFGLAILVTVCAVLMPQAAGNAWERWSNPFDPAPRYTFAEITSFPDQKFVARGESFQILCTVNPNSFWLPEKATLTSDDGFELVAHLNHSSYNFELEGALDPAKLTLTVGDASDQVDVIPLTRPSLRKVNAVIRYPDYLGYPTEHREITGSAVTVPTGSTLTIEAFANRNLSAASTIEENDGRGSLAATINGSKLTLQIGLIEEDQPLRLIWSDVHMLSCGGPRRLEIIAKQDEPPRVDFPGLPTEVAVLETETLDVTVKAIDDYGIRNLRLSWTVRNAGTEEEEKVAREWISDSHAVRSLEGVYPFNPGTMKAPAGSILAIRAY